MEIIYGGEIMERNPVRLQDVYSIRVAQEEETEQWDLIPMVMVDGKLYLDTGMESSVEARCDVMDGELHLLLRGQRNLQRMKNQTLELDTDTSMVHRKEPLKYS